MADKSLNTKAASTRGAKAMVAIVLVTSLFFVWGLTMNLVNAFNSPMGNYLQLNEVETSLLQMAYFSAYFVMAIPATMITKRFGYKGGVISGLALFVIGSLITIPATNVASFVTFLVAMFIVAAGATTLEASCNPYITKLGDEKHEEFRLNLAQAFNGVGNIVGPLILGQILATAVAPGQPGFEAAKLSFLASTRTLYIVIAVALALILVVFLFVKLPTPPGDQEEEASGEKLTFVQMLKRPYFAIGVFSGFLFIGLQVAGQSMLPSYVATYWPELSEGTAVTLIGVQSLLFTIGRFATTPIMMKVPGHKILGVYMLLSAILMFVVFLGLGPVSVIAFIVAYLFISIGFPTIFSVTLKGFHGDAVKTGSSALIMSIVGAAIIPVVLSAIGQAAGINIAMLVMVPGFLFLSWYGFKGSQIGLSQS